MSDPTKQVKPIKERVSESVNILNQLKSLGIPDTDPGYKALSERFNTWIRGGDVWEGNVDFHRWDRRAKVLLPVKSGRPAKCDFLIHKF